ncbi:MAG: hypothetical protein A2Y79_00830 [Deltaproteobacteria bacterium RBG_13_43_22]|nr:MAG: hypothetical protein A2Y79_00830 [Deltaproteobacteria bacterium RBG_13_43_22]
MESFCIPAFAGMTVLRLIHFRITPLSGYRKIIFVTLILSIDQSLPPEKSNLGKPPAKPGSYLNEIIIQLA